VAAADVGHQRAALQLLHDAVERRQPGGEQVGVVAGSEEALAAVQHVVVVLPPAEAGAALRHVGDVRRVEHRPDGYLEETRHVRGAVLVGERDRLLRRQRVATAGRVVLHEAAGRLGVQPLAGVALGDVGATGQLGGRQRLAVGHRPVQAEPVAHHHQRRVERGAHFLHRAEHELIQLVCVQGARVLLDGCHS
jgi:hypothetical protein